MRVAAFGDGEECKEFINDHPDWQYIGLIDSLENVDADLVIFPSVKSVDSIDKLKNIHCIFLAEQIDTRDPNSSLLLSTLLSFNTARTESHSTKIKDGIRKLDDVRWTNVYGYERGYKVVESEAEVVRRIFDEYSHGKSLKEICDSLNESGIRTRRGNDWITTSVNGILHNEKYTGAIGEITNHHKAIIETHIFDLVQKISGMKKGRQGDYPFGASMIVCPICGQFMSQRDLRIQKAGRAWICEELHFAIRSSFIEEALLKTVEYESVEYYWVDELIERIEPGKHEDFVNKEINPVLRREVEGSLSDFNIRIVWKDKTTTVPSNITRLKDVPSIVARTYREKLSGG